MNTQIKHRLTGAVLYECDCDGATDAVRIRQAVVAAVKSGADLIGADLSGANLSRAYLSGAYLSRADLRGAHLSDAKGIIRVGPALDGWEFFGVKHETGVMIKAGCRWFSTTDARDHWTKTRAGTPIGAERLRFVDFIEAHFRDAGK